MRNEGNFNSEELKIQKLISNHLRLQVSSNGLSAEGPHLDEDALSAFVEGNLGQKESQPIVSHLVDCSFCRQVTAELVKLDFALAGETQQIVIKTEATSKITEVLSNILSRIFGTNDGAVFAHQETEEDAEKIEQKEEKKEEDTNK